MHGFEYKLIILAVPTPPDDSSALVENHVGNFNHAEGMPSCRESFSKVSARM